MSGYSITCPPCQHKEGTDGNTTWSSNIVDLIENHLDDDGWIKCKKCGMSGAFIYRSSDNQPPDKLAPKDQWIRWIKGVLTIPRTPEEGFQPYVFLIAHGIDDPVDSIQIGYYKDQRKDGGLLKHGHGPGAGPVIGLQELTWLHSTLREKGVLRHN